MEFLIASSSQHKITFNQRLRRWSGLLLLTLLCALPQYSFGQKKASAYEVQAAMLLSFAKFVEWPNEKLSAPDSPIVIGILGPDPFGSTLDEMVKNQEVAGHKLTIQRLTQSDSVTNCHIVYCASTYADTEKVMSPAKEQKVIFVSETDTFTRLGGHICLYTKDNKVRFEVNLAAFERSGLKMHSQVLKLAPRVTRDGKDVKQ